MVRIGIVAHRGASAYAPEHSFAAYDLALAQGAQTLELDVRASKDGVLFVLHDATLARTAGDPRAIAATTALELAALPQAQRPLRLDAVLRRYGTATRWLIDVKDPAPTWEPAIPAALVRHGVARHAVVQSFDLTALQRLRRIARWLPVAPLLEHAPSPAELSWIARFATGIGVHHPAVNVAVVARAHARGLTVRAWTPNEPTDCARLLATGVDELITDAPAVARAAALAAAA
jgi:glycerophosphoryl diester phosphodiesterase